MDDDPVTLRAEIARLRDLLWDNDIDPDPVSPEPPAPPQFGPPTKADWVFQQMMAQSIRAVMGQYTSQVVQKGFWEDGKWVKPGTTLRIRIPESFKVIS